MRELFKLKQYTPEKPMQSVALFSERMMLIHNYSKLNHSI